MATMYCHKDATKRVPLTAWAATTAKIIGDTIKPTTGAFWLYCIGAGTTGGTEPVWGAVSYLDPIGDGTVVWEVRGTGEFDATNPDRATFDLEETIGLSSKVNGVAATDSVLLLQGVSGNYAPTESLDTVALGTYIGSASLVDGGPGEYNADINCAGHVGDGFSTFDQAATIDRVTIRNCGNRSFDLGSGRYILLLDCEAHDGAKEPIYGSTSSFNLRVFGFKTTGCSEGIQLLPTGNPATIVNSYINIASTSTTQAALTGGALSVENCIVVANGATTRSVVKFNQVNFERGIRYSVIAFSGTPSNASFDMVGVYSAATSGTYPVYVDSCHFENIRNTDGSKVGILAGNTTYATPTYVMGLLNCTANNCDDSQDQGAAKGVVFWDVADFDQVFNDPSNGDWTPTEDPRSYPYRKAVAEEPDWTGTSPSPFMSGGGGGGGSYRPRIARG